MTGDTPAPTLLPAPVIESGRCTGCGRCVAACPPHVLSLEPLGWEKRAVLHDLRGCDGCARCFQVCPFNAIQMKKRVAKEAT